MDYFIASRKKGIRMGENWKKNKKLLFSVETISQFLRKGIIQRRARVTSLPKQKQLEKKQCLYDKKK